MVEVVENALTECKSVPTGIKSRLRPKLFFIFFFNAEIQNALDSTQKLVLKDNTYCGSVEELSKLVENSRIFKARIS